MTPEQQIAADRVRIANEQAAAKRVVEAEAAARQGGRFDEAAWHARVEDFLRRVRECGSVERAGEI